MRRDYRLYLDDILDAIHQIRSYVQGQDEAAFASDRKTQDAVIRNLEIIRAFVHLREMLATHKKLARKLASVGEGSHGDSRVVMK